MFMTCWLFLPVSFLKSDGGNPAFSYFTTLLTVCAVTAMIWLDLCQVGKFWVETCSLLFMKAWISLSHAHSSSMGGRFFCDSLEKNQKLCLEICYHWRIKYWESKEKKNKTAGILGEDWASVPVRDFSAMAVAHVGTCFPSPYVSSSNPFLDARKKNDLSELKANIANSVHFFGDGQFTLIPLSLCLIYLSKSFYLVCNMLNVNKIFKHWKTEERR